MARRLPRLIRAYRIRPGRFVHLDSSRRRIAPRHNEVVGASLIVTADDYGYRPAYDRGVLEAARAGAVDSVSAIVGEGCAAGPLLETGVEIGLHLDFSRPGEDPRANVERQLAAFEQLFRCPPAYLDAHHHAHAAPDERARALAGLASALGMPVRSVSTEHRTLLRACGVATPDRLIGRLDETEPLPPAEIKAARAGERLPPGVTEWMAHPGHTDPGAGSAYDAGREQDLRLLLELAGDSVLREHRSTHSQALGNRGR